MQADVVVSGHTHMQFDRMVGKIRVVNAGSVGAPIGDPGAFWVLLGPEIELQCTRYDRVKASELIRNTHYPQAQEEADRILKPSSSDEVLELFSRYELMGPANSGMSG